MFNPTASASVVKINDPDLTGLPIYTNTSSRLMWLLLPLEADQWQIKNDPLVCLVTVIQMAKQGKGA